MKRLIATTALALFVAAPAIAAGTNTAADANAQTTPPAASMPKTAEPTLGEKAEKAADNAGQAIEKGVDKTGAAMTAAGEKIESKVDAAMTEEGWIAVDATTVTAEQLEDADVYDASNNEVGEVADLVLGDDGKTVNGAVIDVGGFLGMGEHRVMIPMSDLKIMTQADDKDDFRVYIAATKEQLEAMPEYEI